jgi:kinesin family protein 2/24
VWVSFFEIYGGRCQYLLHRKRLTIREDGAGEVQIVDLEEVQPTTTEELLQIINKGNSLRTTHATEMNDVSSRSHCICQITVRERGSTQLYGKLSLIDLAGSERGQDTKNHNRQRRMESSEINKSLLALKECFRYGYSCSSFTCRNTAIDDISADTTEHWTAVVVALIFRFAQAS